MTATVVVGVAVKAVRALKFIAIYDWKVGHQFHQMLTDGQRL
jgi:hypothetical protein